MDELWTKIERKAAQMLADVGEKTPHATNGGVYDDTSADWWTSGFWPGILWLMYDKTGDERYMAAAWGYDERIEATLLRDNRLHHDVGFQFLPTAVFKHALTGDNAARRRALQMAGFLAGRFNLAGRYIRAWNSTDMLPDAAEGAIIDTCMNLPLLFWAAKEDNDPRFAHIAAAHADTVAERFIRPDGSAAHILRFNPATGELIEELGGQAFAPGSAWARGQAWAMYGLTSAYRSTGREAYLSAARRVAHFFISNLEGDCVPLWDFRVPNPEGEPRDTSAAACAAGALADMAACLRPEDGRLYLSWAKRIIRSLSENYADWDGAATQGILRRATGHKPAGQNVGISLIYGDYFFVEAAAKLAGWGRHIF